VGLRSVVYDAVEPTANKQALGSKFQPAGSGSRTIKSMMEGSSQVFLSPPEHQTSLQTAQALTNKRSNRVFYHRKQGTTDGIRRRTVSPAASHVLLIHINLYVHCFIPEG